MPAPAAFQHWCELRALGDDGRVDAGSPGQRRRMWGRPRQPARTFVPAERPAGPERSGAGDVEQVADLNLAGEGRDRRGCPLSADRQSRADERRGSRRAAATRTSISSLTIAPRQPNERFEQEQIPLTVVDNGRSIDRSTRPAQSEAGDDVCPWYRVRPRTIDAVTPPRARQRSSRLRSARDDDGATPVPRDENRRERRNRSAVANRRAAALPVRKTDTMGSVPAREPVDERSDFHIGVESDSSASAGAMTGTPPRRRTMAAVSVDEPRFEQRDLRAHESRQATRCPSPSQFDRQLADGQSTQTRDRSTSRRTLEPRSARPSRRSNE